MRYTVRTILIGLRIVENATSQGNKTVENNRTTLSWSNISLANGQSSVRPYTFQINAIGLWELQFLLFKNGDLSGVYREVHMFARVAFG